MNMTHRLDIYVYQISSNHLKGYKLLSAQAFYSKVDSREITQKGNKGELPFKNVTHHFDLIYKSTEYHQHISKGINVIKHTSIPL